MIDPITSHSLALRARQVAPGGVHSPVRSFAPVSAEPLYVSRASGAYLYDVEENRYVDYVGSWGPLILGHAQAAVVKAIQEQAAKGTSFGLCSEPEVLLAEFITSKMPSVEMIRFVNSGTEATMSALRLARAFTERPKAVKFVGCYHGHADSLLVEAGSGALTLGIPGSAGVTARLTEDTLSAQFNDIGTVRELFERAGDQIAAVIVEPVVGNCGLILPEGSFLQDLRALTAQYGALLIFDEVMTGFRVHLGGAQALYGITPDLTTLGKVIGGGLPVGAYGGRRDIMSLVAPLGPVYQAGTLSGNPLAMAAGLATLQGLFAENCFDAIAAATERLVETFCRTAHDVGIELQAHSVGTMFGIFFTDRPVRDFRSACRSDKERYARFFREALARGVLFAPSPFEAGFVSAAHIGEPLCETEGVIRQIMPMLR